MGMCPFLALDSLSRALGNTAGSGGGTSNARAAHTGYGDVPLDRVFAVAFLFFFPTLPLCLLSLLRQHRCGGSEPYFYFCVCLFDGGFSVVPLSRPLFRCARTPVRFAACASCLPHLAFTAPSPLFRCATRAINVRKERYAVYRHHESRDDGLPPPSLHIVCRLTCSPLPASCWSDLPRTQSFRRGNVKKKRLNML